MKPPDHSILSFAFKLNKSNCSESKHLKSESTASCPTIRYTFSNIPDNFMNSTEWSNVITDMISNIENNIHSEVELSEWYCKFCNAICLEMDKFSLCKDSSIHVKMKFKYYKPYSNKELTSAWKYMNVKEKLFRKFKGPRGKKIY